MSFGDKFKDKILASYKRESDSVVGGGTVELEIRFQPTERGVDRDTFEKLLTAVLSSSLFAPATLEKSINIISYHVAGVTSPNHQFIRKITYSDTPVSSYVEKIRVEKSAPFDDYIPYTISLATEHPTSEFSSAQDATARFKARVSADIVGKPWRVDFTAVYMRKVAELGDKINTTRREFFPDSLTAAGFLETARLDMAHAFEVELEYIGKESPVKADFDIVNVLFELVNADFGTEMVYQDEIYNIATKILPSHARQFKSNNNRLKRLANQVSAVSKNTYYANVFPPVGCYVTEKADGVRAFVSVYGGRVRVLRSDGMTETGAVGANPTATIVDCEIINDKYYVFDVMMIADKNISQEGFERRVEHIDAAAKIVTEALSAGGGGSGAGGVAISKRFVKIDEDTDLEAAFRSVYEAKYDYLLDGLIITAPGKSYKDTANYKWKPYDHNTIDFIAMKCPRGLLGFKPFMVEPGRELYVLFVGINNKDKEILGLGFMPQYTKVFPVTEPMYFPIQFSPSAMPYAYLYWHDPAANSAAGDLHGKIVELARDSTNSAWVFKRVRTDRAIEQNYYGNDYRIAEMTFMNYVDRFEFEDLWQKNESYFQGSGEDIYISGNKLRRFAISCVLRDNFAKMRWLIDLAAGRGADLHKYQELRVDNALFIEVDTTAVAELVRRKFEFIARKRGGGGGGDALTPAFIKDTTGLTVHTMVADLRSDYNTLIAGTYQYGVNTSGTDGIVCNFAIHYMCESIKDMRNILLFVSKMLKSGGIFLFTTMDGGAVFDLLRDKRAGEKWTVYEGEVLKYAIERRYSGDKLADAGQKIAVKLPFTEDLVEEPLCNVDKVIAECAKLGMNLELNMNMLEYFDKFKAANPTLASKLTKDDRDYTALFRLVTVRMK